MYKYNQILSLENRQYCAKLNSLIIVPFESYVKINVVFGVLFLPVIIKRNAEMQQ
jgi:hypothetical protein